MRSEKLFLLINEIDERLIAEAEGGNEFAEVTKVTLEKRFPLKEIIALTACAAALVVCVLTVIQLRVEVPLPDSSNSTANAGNSSSFTSNISGSSSVIYDSSETSGNSDTESNISIIESNISDIESSIADLQIGLNADVVWGIGKTFDEINAKYGEVISGNFNRYTFGWNYSNENKLPSGYGTYVWDYGGGIDNSFADREKNIEYIRRRGGCYAILNIKASDFINGEFTAMSFDDFASKCGIEWIHIDDDPNDQDPFIADQPRYVGFKHPSYENITFTMICDRDKNEIDDTTFFDVRYDRTNGDPEARTFPASEFEQEIWDASRFAETIGELKQLISDRDPNGRIDGITVYTDTGMTEKITEGELASGMLVYFEYDRRYDLFIILR